MKLVLFAGIIIISAGCMPKLTIPETEAQLYPHNDGTYSAVALSYSESDGRRAVLKRAERKCKADNQQLVVLENNIEYQGVGKEIDAITSMIDRTVSYNTDSRGTGTTKSIEDYKATLKFSCE